MVPEGATPIDPVGTAPGLVVPAGEQVVIVLPGPPRELQGMWESAIGAAPAREMLARAQPYHELPLRLFAMPESELAASLRDIGAEIDLSTLEITTCLRGGELAIQGPDNFRIEFDAPLDRAAPSLRGGVPHGDGAIGGLRNLGIDGLDVVEEQPGRDFRRLLLDRRRRFDGRSLLVRGSGRLGRRRRRIRFAASGDEQDENRQRECLHHGLVGGSFRSKILNSSGPTGKSFSSCSFQKAASSSSMWRLYWAYHF